MQVSGYLSASFVEKTSLSPLNCFDIFVQNGYTCESISRLSLLFIDLFVQPYDNTTLSLILHLYIEIRKCESSVCSSGLFWLY